MGDRVGSDHPTITTERARVVRHGGRRRRLDLATASVLPAEGVVEVIVDGRCRFGRCRTIGGQPAIVGLYDTRAAAGGDTEGTDRLTRWLTDADRRPGSSVDVDVIEAGVRVGLRVPGERAVYDVVGRRDGPLDELARDLGDTS